MQFNIDSILKEHHLNIRKSEWAIDFLSETNIEKKSEEDEDFVNAYYRVLLSKSGFNEFEETLLRHKQNYSLERFVRIYSEALLAVGKYQEEYETLCALDREISRNWVHRKIFSSLLNLGEPEKALDFYRKKLDGKVDELIFKATWHLGHYKEAYRISKLRNKDDFQADVVNQIYNGMETFTNSGIKASCIYTSGEELPTKSTVYAFKNSGIKAVPTQGVYGASIPTVVADRFFDSSLKSILGNGFAHINAWERFLETDDEYLIVLESDALPVYPIEKKTIERWLKKYDVIYLNERLGRDWKKGRMEIGTCAKYQHREKASGFDGYCFKRNVVEKLLEEVSKEKFWYSFIDSVSIKWIYDRLVDRDKIGCLNVPYVRHTLFSPRSSRLRAELLK